MIHLPRVLTAAGEIQQFCQQRDWRFCFIGGVAVQRWGQPRLTTQQGDHRWNQQQGHNGHDV